MTLNYWTVVFYRDAVLFVFFVRFLTQMRLAVDLLGFGISLPAIDSVDSVLRYDEFTLIISLPYIPLVRCTIALAP